MNKVILSLLFVLAGTFSVFAQDTPTWDGADQPANSVNIEDDMSFVPESWDTDLESLMNAWYVKYYVNKNSHPGYGEPVVASDAVYVDRLSKMNTIIELPYNDVVRKCIDMYVDRRRTIVEYMLGLDHFYFPMIEQALDANGLPMELKYLTVVESALNPVAFSRAGACGLWQFMLGTGKQYGLEVNSLVDERRDPLKSTYAACAYLKDLYGIYGNWTLALAAYNCGPGNVNKAIRRANGSTDYWQIYPYLPRETRLYVPLFIAANYVMTYYANHKLYPVQTNLPMSTDTVMVTQSIHFDQIASVLNMDKDLIRALNPQYKRDIVPGNSKPRAIRLPVLQTYAFVEKEDAIANYRKDELFTNRIYAETNNNGPEKITHRVRKGESIQSIGNKYGVSVASIRKWNGLRSNKVAAGKRLAIYVDNGTSSPRLSAGASPRTTSPTNAINSENTANTNGLSADIPSLEETKAAVEIAMASAGKHQYEQQPQSYSSVKTTERQTPQYGKYKVKSGDSFHSIAKKYPGYSEQDIMKLNRMNNSKLKAGQYIKVPKE